MQQSFVNIEDYRRETGRLL
ncbi:hypothetical protein LINPERPRIM_LOCUS21721 [Linum perenne]